MTKQAGRLALRQEGKWWVGYFALPNTMDGAIELGRIAIHFVEDQDRKDRFMGLMRDAVTDILQEKGAEVTWPNPPQPAPEHERGGHS